MDMSPLCLSREASSPSIFAHVLQFSQSQMATVTLLLKALGYLPMTYQLRSTPLGSGHGALLALASAQLPSLTPC